MKLQRLRFLEHDAESGRFRPRRAFKRVEPVAQLDILNDWLWQMRNYYRHVLMLCLLENESESIGASRSREERIAIFREVATKMGWEVPENFEAFALEHFDCTLTPAQLDDCPLCHRE